MLPIGRRVFVCTEPQDMRRGFDRLAQVVVKEMGGDPRSGDVFVFTSRGCDRVKVLFWDFNGYEAHAKATSEREQYRALYMRLLERCRVLERGIIAGKKAERFDGEDAGQLSMQLLGMLLAEGEAPVEEVADAGEDDLELDDLEDDGDEDELAGADAPGDACAPRRRRRGRRKLPEALPRVEIEVLPPEVIQEGLDAFERIGEVASEAVERRPASVVVVRIIRPKFVHKATPDPDPRAEDDGEPEAPTVLIAEPPEKPIERGLAGPGLLAATIVQRWQDHLPAHRQEAIWARDGLPLARSTICSWHQQLADLTATRLSWLGTRRSR